MKKGCEREPIKGSISLLLEENDFGDLLNECRGLPYHVLSEVSAELDSTRVDLETAKEQEERQENKVEGTDGFGHG